MDTRTIVLIESATNTPTAALLDRRLSVAQVLAAEAAWKPLRETLAELIEHGHWDWSRKTPLLGDPAARFVGIELGGDMQGMMARVEDGHRSRLAATRGAPLVYVEYLEAAPWNLRLPNATPRYKTVGRQLVVDAVGRSVELGFEGRVGLVALPRAEDFYERTCGMRSLGPDPECEGLVYYEFGAAEALRLLTRG